LGAAVLMTRTDDTNPTLGDRVTAMNTQCPDFFIAIHHNSIELTSDVNLSAGTEVYWFYSAGEPLADNLIAQVCAATGRADRASHYGYYYVTRSNICPAVLLELGFVTNPAEYEACADTQTIWAEGGAIAQAVYDTVAGTDAAAGTQGTGAADSAAAGSADPAEGASLSGSAAGAGA
jgi:N-acetylmuramoyl-L-alanine amidase